MPEGVGGMGASAPIPLTPRLAQERGVPARQAALELLVRVGQGSFADVLLGHRLAAIPSGADRRLITRLVLATTAWQARLDYELERLSSRPLASLDPEILALLRMSLCQIRLMTRVPPHAAVDTAVSLARDVASDRAAGFVNAILRQALRNPVALPKRDDDEIGYLAVALSHPRWMVEHFVRWFGIAAAEALMAANNEAAPNVLRLNLTHGNRDDLIGELKAAGMDVIASQRFPETVTLLHAPIFESEVFHSGLCYPQSEASQLVAAMLAAPSGAIVVDCAAAPGGKTTHLAQMVGPDGKIIALDLSRSGLHKMRPIAKRQGLRNLALIRADCAGAIPLRSGSFAHVLLDAPCTGIGTLREHPEIRWRLAPGDFARMAKLQLRMLEQAAALLRPDGVLVYSVCSLAPEEGEGVVNAFLASHHGFAIDYAPASDERFTGLIGADGFMRTRPDRGGLDGFFAARIRRQG